MRESLTILAIAVILVLSALLVGPYFIDWSGQRDFLAARLSKAFGAKVAITGPVDVRLLPRPLFRVGQVTIEGAAPHDPRVTVRTLDAELSLNGLLQGGFEFLDATVLGPQLEVTVRSDGSVIGPALDVVDPQTFQFKHVNISDGTILIRNEAGAQVAALGGLKAQGEADSLAGPLKLSGSFGPQNQRIAFRLNTGTYGAKRLRVKLSLDGLPAFARVETDGFLTFATAASGGHSAPGFEGSLNLAGSLHIADGAAPVPWRSAIANLKVDGPTLKAEGIELRAGADGRALVAIGSGSFDWRNGPAAALALRARQLDLDRLAVPPEVAPDTPRPTARQWRAALDSIAEEASGQGLPFALSLDAGIDAITTGDLTFTDAKVNLDGRPNLPIAGRFALSGPEATRIALDGAFELGAAPGFKGHAEAATRNVPRATSWFAAFWPELAPYAGENARLETLDFAGDLTLSKVGVAARDISLALNGSALGGTFSLTSAVAGERPRFFADLTADHIDVTQLPELSVLMGGAAPLDISVGLASRTARLSGADYRPVESGQLSLHVTKTADLLTLDRFSVTGLGGASATATATVGADRQLRSEGRIDAKDVAPLAAVLRSLLPGAFSELLTTYAGPLSPLTMAFKAEANVAENGSIDPTLATADGDLGGVRVSAAFTPQAAEKFGEARVKMALKLDAADAGAALQKWGIGNGGASGPGHAEATGTGTLRSGFDGDASLTLPDLKASFGGRFALGSGAGHFKASGTRAASAAALFGVAMPGTMGGTPWDSEGDAGWQNGALTLGQLTGHVNGSSLRGTLEWKPTSGEAGTAHVLGGALAVDNATLGGLASLALVPPPQSGPASADFWSRAKFSPMAKLPRADIALKIGTLDLWPGLSARDAGLSLQISPGAVTLADITSRLLDGTAKGSVTFRRDGPTASIASQLNLNGVPLNLPSLGARLSATLNLAATGQSPSALAASLAGEGSITLAGARMPQLNPGALGDVAKTFDVKGYETESVSIDDATVREALATQLDKGALALGDITSPAIVAGGVLRVVGLQTKGGTFNATSEGAFDFNTQKLTVRTTVSATELPRDWKGDPPQVTVTWSGPAAAPERTVDAGSFVNGLAARAIARDQERIELMQSDLRERAFFARRLKQIEAEQQAARDAALIQKMIPTPPKPGDIRLPKPVDPALPPVAGQGGRAPNAVRSGQDDISKYLETLPPLQLAPAKALTKPGTPAQAQPAVPAPPNNSQNAAPPRDPTEAGRY